MLEVSAQRKAQEGPPGRHELHARAEASLNEREVRAGEVLEEVVHVGPHLEPVDPGKRIGGQPGAGHEDHAKFRHAALHGRVRVCNLRQEILPDRGAADGRDRNLLVLPVAEPGADRLGVGERRGVERQRVAAVGEVTVSPCSDAGQAWTERRLRHVLRIADEDGRVAHVGKALDVLDVVGVPVRAEEGFPLVVLHRQASHEVRQEDERLALELGVLVVIVVDLPRLVADHQIVVLALHQVDEGHEVVRHELVHRSEREERRQVVLARDVLEVLALAREPRGQRV